MPGSSEYDTSAGVQDPAAAGPRGPGPHEQIPPNKPPWFDQPHPVAPWGQQQVLPKNLLGVHTWLSQKPAHVREWCHVPLISALNRRGHSDELEASLVYRLPSRTQKSPVLEKSLLAPSGVLWHSRQAQP